MAFKFWKNVNYLKNYDAYSKPLEDFRIKTVSGAVVSLISGLIIIILAVSELNEYLRPEIKQELFVDVTRGQKLPIILDIIFPEVACDFISLDAMDVSGDQQLDVDHEIYKIRLDKNLQPISEAELHNVTSTKTAAVANNTSHKEISVDITCGSCYGAERDDLKCCNTCESVREAYRVRGWAMSTVENIKQCKDEGWDLKIKKLNNEGCRMHGKLSVNKVAGNFHFAPGRSYTQSHVHVHDIQSFGKTQFNISHNINYLSFGDRYPGILNPLDQLNVKVDEMSHMYTYYVKVVPTTYVKQNGTILRTNQFSVTKHIKPTALSGGHDGLPGVFFNYEIAPIMVLIKETNKPFVQFITNLCAIIGGVFTVLSKRHRMTTNNNLNGTLKMGHQNFTVFWRKSGLGELGFSSLIDSFIYHSSKVVREKLEAGKLS